MLQGGDEENRRILVAGKERKYISVGFEVVAGAGVPAGIGEVVAERRRAAESTALGCRANQ